MNDNNNNINFHLASLDLRLTRLEEKVDLLANKKYINNHVKEQIRLLNVQYGKLLSSLRKEFEKYNPNNQLKVKRLIIKALPEHAIKSDFFFSSIKNSFEKNNVYYNQAEIEIWLMKIGILKDDLINKNNLSSGELKKLMDTL